MAYVLFLLVNFVLLVRPHEFMPALMGLHLYEALIVACMVVSLPQLITYVTHRSVNSQPITLCVYGVFIAVWLSNLTQFNFGPMLDGGVQFAKVLVYYLLLVSLVTSPSRIRAFIVWMVFCIASMTLVSVLRYHDVIETPPPPVPVYVEQNEGYQSERGNAAHVVDTILDPITGNRVEVKRLRGTGVFQDPNDLALMIVVGVCLALYWLVEKDQGVYRLLALAPLSILLYALYTTSSRGGFLCLMAGLAVLFHARFGWRKSLVLGALIMPVLFVLFAGRMTDLNASEGTGQSRIQIWSDGLVLFRYNFLFGIGMDQFAVQVAKVAHNSFIHSYTELGILGGTLFLGAFYFAVLTLRRLGADRLPNVQPELRLLQPFLVATVMAYCVGMLTLSRSFIVPTYMVLGLITAYANVVAGQSPVTLLRFDGRLARKLALASIVFLVATYVFVRVWRV